MPTPTFISAASTALNNVTTPKTLSVTVAVGDDLLVLGTTGDSGTTLGTPTGGSGFTWTLLDSSVVSSNTTVYLWKTTATAAQTFTLSITRAGTNTNFWGFGVIRFSGVTGYGTPAKTTSGSGAPSQAITTVEANSTIAMVTSDWNAVTGTRTYRTINGYTPTVGGAGEVGGFNGDGSNYGVSIGYWPDAGATGSKTAGTTAPTGQKYTILAVEVKGTASGGGGPVSGTVAGTSAVAGTVTVLLSETGTAAGISAVSGTVTALLAVTGVAAGTSTAVGSPAGLFAVSGAVAGVSGASLAVNALVAGTVAGTSSVSGNVTAKLAVSGSAVATSGAAGTVTALLGVSGTTAGISADTGTVTGLYPVSGTVAGVSAVSGSVTLISGGSLAVSGTVAATSGASGSVALLGSVTGSAVATSSVSATPSLRAGVSGSASGSSATSGTVQARLAVVGTIAAFTQVFGGVTSSTDVFKDIAVTGVIAPRRWGSTLTARAKYGSLDPFLGSGTLDPRNTYGTINDRRWKGSL